MAKVRKIAGDLRVGMTFVEPAVIRQLIVEETRVYVVLEDGRTIVRAPDHEFTVEEPDPSLPGV